MAQSTPKQLLEGAVSHAQESVKSLAQSIGVQLNSQFAENAFFWNVVINHRIRDPENDAIIHGYTALGSVRDSIDDGHFSEKLRGYIEDLVEEVDGLCAKYELFKNSGKINATIGVKFVEEIRRDYPERKHEVDFLPPSKSMKTGEAVKVSKYDSSDELRTGQMASFEKPVTMVDSGFSSSAEPQSPNKHHHGGRKSTALPSGDRPSLEKGGLRRVIGALSQLQEDLDQHGGVMSGQRFFSICSQMDMDADFVRQNTMLREAAREFGVDLDAATASESAV